MKGGIKNILVRPAHVAQLLHIFLFYLIRGLDHLQDKEQKGLLEIFEGGFSGLTRSR